MWGLVDMTVCGVPCANVRPVCVSMSAHKHEYANM